MRVGREDAQKAQRNSLLTLAEMGGVMDDFRCLVGGPAGTLGSNRRELVLTSANRLKKSRRIATKERRRHNSQFLVSARGVGFLAEREKVRSGVNP